MNQAVQPHIPEGYMMDSQGRLVPADQVSEQDQLRDQLVNELVPKGLALHQMLKDYKDQALNDIEDLVTIAGERYGAKLGGKKGNVTLTSYDGQYKVVRNFREVIAFTEEIEAGKALIDNCLRRWSTNADPHLMAVVEQAFRTNTKGEIRTGKILDLMRLSIDDDEWKRAMEALKDAMKNTGTAVYVRLYERIGKSDQYRPIPLDLASV